MSNHNLIQFDCQFSLTEERVKQFLSIIKLTNLKYYHMQAANDEIIIPQLSNSDYTAKELAAILGLNCSNDVEYLVKKLGLKMPKYGRWIFSNKLPDSTNQFYYNQTALARLVTYLELTKEKVA